MEELIYNHFLNMRGKKQLISQERGSEDSSLRQVENTYNDYSRRRNHKVPSAKYEVEDMSDIMPAQPSDMHEEIIEDSEPGGRTGEKFQARVAKAEVLLNLGSENYDQLEEISQSNFASKENFRGYDKNDSIKGEVKVMEGLKSNQSIPSVRQIGGEYLVDSKSVFEKISPGGTLQCELRRDKKSLSGMIEYHVIIQATKQHLITVRKEGMWEYVIYFREQGEYIKIAKLESTFLSNRYSLVKEGEKCSEATICYESNFLGLSGPRRMHIYLPRTKLPLKFLDECYGDLNFREKIEKCVNKQPVWNEKEQSYVLSFKGRAKESSIKNFVITDSLESQEKHLLIFGKAGPEIYNLDIESPFSLIQGIAVALTTFEHKLTCD